MKILDVHIKPEFTENLDLYNFAAIYLSTHIDIDKDGMVNITAGKEPPIEYNCCDGLFTYDNFIPNATIVELFNKKLDEFAAIYPEWKDEINERFSAYLWANSDLDLDGRYKKPVMKCDMEEFARKCKLHPHIMRECTAAKEDFETKLFNEPEKYELVYEYDTDKQGMRDAALHKNVVNGDYSDGMEWRYKEKLRTLKKGHEFEVFVAARLKNQYGIDIGLIYDEKGQTKGETKVGIELKNDLMSVDTLNAYVECGESRNGKDYNELIHSGVNPEDIIYGCKHNTPLIKSGILKDDNTKFLVFGPKERLLIVRKDVLRAYYEQEVKGKRNIHKRTRGCYIEYPANGGNAVNKDCGIIGRELTVTKKDANGHEYKTKVDASVGYVLSFDKMEELAEDFGIDGIARVLIAEGYQDHTKCPPDKELQIERDKYQYVTDKLKTLQGSKKTEDGWIHRIDHANVENHKNDSACEKAGIHLTYTDNFIRLEYEKKEEELLKASARLDELKQQRQEALEAGKSTTTFDSAIAKGQKIYEEKKVIAEAYLENSTVTAYINAEESHDDGMIRVPIEGLCNGQGLWKSEADVYIHVDVAHHNSDKEDMMYIFDKDALKRAIGTVYRRADTKDKIKIGNDAGIKYALVPIKMINDLDKEFHILEHKQSSTHVNLVIDLEDSDIRDKLPKEYHMDHCKYDNLDVKTQNPFVIDTGKDDDFLDF